MKQLNTLPIEDFLDKARIAKKGNQKSITLTTKEYSDLADSIALVMTRLSGEMDQILSSAQPGNIEVKMNGGSF